MNRLTRVVDTSSKQSSVLETTRLDRHALHTLTTCNCYPDSTFRRHSSSRSPAVQPLIDDHLPQAHHLPQQLLQREAREIMKTRRRESNFLTDMTSLVRLYGGLRIGSFAKGAVNEDTIRASGRCRSVGVQGLSIDGWFEHDLGCRVRRFRHRKETQLRCGLTPDHYTRPQTLNRRALNRQHPKWERLVY